MILLTKGAEPNVLVQNGTSWTAELLQLISSGEVVPERIWSRYKHPEIKMAVQRDSKEKCIYCESAVLHVSHGDIEHMRPKKKFPALTYVWTNLGLACTKCNGAKSDQFPDATPPVNPYSEDPSQFFMPVGELIWPKPGNDRGSVTESILKLNRPELVDRRRQRIERIRQMVDAYVRAANNDVKRVLFEQLGSELDDAKEYLFVSRAAWAALSQHVPAPP